MQQRTKQRYLTSAAYLAAVSLCILIETYVLGLNHGDWKIPYIYWEDGFSMCAWIKGMLDNGWFLDNRLLGAPAGLNWSDYPVSEGLHFLWMRFIGFFVNDFGAVHNGY